MDNFENDIKKKIEEVESLAAGLLKEKNKSIPRRPIVIEFCGSPKSGKTTCINSLELFLRRNKFRTKILTERASVCPIKDKFDPNFNFWTACSSIAEFSQILGNHSKNYDVVILDRGIFDAICWFDWLHQNQCMRESDFKGVVKFLTIHKWRSVIDLVYVFTAEPDVSLEREHANLLTRKQGRIMQNSNLLSYKKCIESNAKKYSRFFQKIEVFDTSDKSMDDGNYIVTKKVLGILRGNIVEKIGYVERKTISSGLSECFKYTDLGIAEQNLSFDFRDSVEKDKQKIQPIPILVITNEERSKIFVVKKNKSNTSIDSPEKGKLLLYLGGHTRKEDSFSTSAKNILEISKEALTREIREEIGLNYFIPNTELDPLCIWIRDGSRSENHLAICFILQVDLSTFKFTLDKQEFMTANNTKSGSILSIPEIVKREKELENWSKIILREEFNVPINQWQPSTLDDPK